MTNVLSSQKNHKGLMHLPFNYRHLNAHQRQGLLTRHYHAVFIEKNFFPMLTSNFFILQHANCVLIYVKDPVLARHCNCFSSKKAVLVHSSGHNWIAMDWSNWESHMHKALHTITACSHSLVAGHGLKAHDVVTLLKLLSGAAQYLDVRQPWNHQCTLFCWDNY